MTNDLLKHIKEMGFSHDQVVNILKEYTEGKEGEESNEDTEPEEPTEPVGKVNDDNQETNTSTDINIDKIQQDLAKNINETITKSISEEVQKQLKKIRNEPPKGESTDARGGNPPVIKKNLYEKWV